MTDRVSTGDLFASMPTAHKVMIGISAAVLAMAGFLFVGWVSTPSYTLLYSGLDDDSLAEVVNELERQGVAYEVEGGGSRVLVPQSQVHQVRADLVTAGVNATTSVDGYEIIDGQGLNVSDGVQAVNIKRALEGELTKTIVTMDSVDNAEVHLVLPEQTLFAEDQEPATASVLLETSRNLTATEVETVLYILAGSVEGLSPDNVTVADVSGRVLHAAGQEATASVTGDRNLQMTRQFEQTLATDIDNLLAAAIGPGHASVVVRARLNFDEETTETETYDPESTVVLREQTINEAYNGVGDPPGGVIGVDGGVEPEADTDPATTDYERAEATREFGADRVVTRSVNAPGKIENLSVAVLLDDGTGTGANVPAVEEVESLIAAAVGLDAGRGDEVAVSTIAFPAPAEIVDEAEPAAEVAAPAAGPMDLIPQAIGGAVLVVVAVSLLLMTRRGRRRKGDDGGAPEAQVAVPAALGAGTPEPAPAGGALPASAQTEVMDLIQRQPEEMAVLLRSWLADRR